MWQTFAVPNKKLAALALTVTGPAVPGSSAQREPYTFIEVEKVLKR
jgi:hypothetical protein